MGNAVITMRGDLCEDGCELTIANNWFTFGIILVPILIGIWSICYTFRNKQRQRRTDQNNECFSQCESTVMNSTSTIEIYFPFIIPVILSQQVNIHRNVCCFTTSKTHTARAASVDIYGVPLVEINKSVNEVFSLFEERKLICYCDGSYSHYMQIGYSGFRASDGAYRIRFLSPRDPKYGSTNAEVRAAYLAIRYALEKHYSALIIHTDNSKVEQLLERPKKKDNINYSDICQILNQYRKQQGDNAIQVVRVRGHTSRYEQEKSCESLEKTILDFHALSYCHLAVISKSSFGHLAIMRRIHPYEELYLYCNGIKKIDNPDDYDKYKYSTC